MPEEYGEYVEEVECEGCVCELVTWVLYNGVFPRVNAEDMQVIV